MSQKQVAFRPNFPITARKEPDTDTHECRFKVPSSSSDKLYLVSRKITTQKWQCSCPSWCTRRYCHHLEDLGIPRFMSDQYEEFEQKKLTSGRRR
jgi:hypothetical protein